MTPDPLFFYNEEKHEYRYNSIVLPHPTGLLKEFGLLDYSSVPPDRLEYKRQLGSAVDKACELDDMNCLDGNSVHPDIAPFVLAWVKFKQVEKFTPILNQTSLVSRKLKFAGRLDKFGIFRGSPSILDIKCTWSMYPSTGPQLASYEILVDENYDVVDFSNLGIDLKGRRSVYHGGIRRYGVLLKETGNYDVVQFKDPLDKSVFLSCLQLHNWKKKYGGAKSEDTSNVDE